MWWKVDLYNNQQWPVQWLDWEETPNHFPKPNVHPKKVMVTVWWSAASLIYYSFLNLSKTITSKKYAQFTDEMHQKLKCLVLVNRKDPILLHDNAWLHVAQPTFQKLNEVGYRVLPHLPCSSELSPTTTSSINLTAFCRESTPTTSRMQKMLSKSSSNHEAWIFMLQE